MCWKCGRVRPYDGPRELQLLGYCYLLPSGQIAMANEHADWEGLEGWPDWKAEDNSGELYFKMREMWPEVFMAAYREAMFVSASRPSNIMDRKKWERIYALAKAEFWGADYAK